MFFRGQFHRARADRTAGAVALGPGVDKRLPHMALAAAPPDLLIAAKGHILRPQLPVQRLMPLLRQLRLQGPQVVEAGQHLPPGAVRAPRALLLRPGENHSLPAVAQGAAPPDLVMGRRQDPGGVQVVLLTIPLLQNIRPQGRQVRLAGNGPLARAIGTAAALHRHAGNDRFPFMALFADPPHLPVRTRCDLPGSQLVLRIPELQNMGMGRRQVRFTGDGIPPGTIGTGRPGLDGIHRRLPGMAPLTAPPDGPVTSGGYVPGRQAAIAQRMPQLRHLRCQGGHVILTGDDRLVRAIGTAAAAEYPGVYRCLPLMALPAAPPDFAPGTGIQFLRFPAIPLRQPLRPQTGIVHKVIL